MKSSFEKVIEKLEQDLLVSITTLWTNLIYAFLLAEFSLPTMAPLEIIFMTLLKFGFIALSALGS